MLERNEIDVRRQQHQFDAHQQHHDILSIKKNTGNTDGK
jgi:hypothetical protein